MADYGMQFSPDLWPSGSSLEESLPLPDLATWVESFLEQEMSNSCDTSEAVSSSVAEEEQVLAVPGNQDGNNTAPLHDPSTAPEKPKGKARVAFTECQLDTLVRHFNQKLYLDPNEMKHLAQMTGLTYKQVKTWFQNRRSKFRRSSRHQLVNQGVPLHFQGEGQPPLREQYSHVAGHGLNANGADNQAHYPHAVGNVVARPQWTFPNSPQMCGCSMPPSNGHNQFNPVFFLNTGMNENNSRLPNTSFDRDSGEPCQQPKLH